MELFRCRRAGKLGRSFERVCALQNPALLPHFKEVAHEFTELSHMVDEELVEGEAMLKDAIETTHSEEARAEFEHLLTVLETVEAEHADYEQLAVQTFALIAAGQLLHPGEIASKIEAEQDHIDKELEGALLEIEKFTENALLTAEAHEKSAVMIIAIAAVAAIAVATVTAAVVAAATVSAAAAAVAARAGLACRERREQRR